MTADISEVFPGREVSSGRLRAAWRRLWFLTRQRTGDWIDTDFAQLSLWSPVAIGLGAGFYFALRDEPHWMAGAIALAAASLLTAFAGAYRKPALGLLLAALGFVAADWRTARVYAPALERELKIGVVTGRLISIEQGAKARRIIIKLEAIHGIAPEDLPALARISWRGEGFEAAPGEMISLRAGLGPPPPPAAPGTFDFARQLYFQRIGAVGFAVTPPTVISDAPLTRRQRYAAAVETLRFNLFSRITRAAPGEGGAIIAAIVTGKRDAISDRARAALRDTGLAHLLAISGLHMGLATGLIFFTVRLGLAAIEPLALRFPIKKWAAAAALLSGLFYLILSGGGWSARRAFIMAAIMFAAILVDRRALSLRNVAIAATIILLSTPEALFHPGFQMSFAAVTALIAGYEWARRRADPHRSFTMGARFKRYAVALAMTDIIAALATAPYALYHFNRVAVFSLPANVVAMPLMGMWIIPAAVIALVLAPFGLDGWAWRLSAAGMEVVLAIASKVASWPGAVSLTTQWPLIAMVLLSVGGLWLCLSRTPLRLAGLLALPLAGLMVAKAEPPQVFVAASGLNAAVIMERAGGVELAAYSGRRDKFSLSVWKEAAGLDPASAETVMMRDAGACDEEGCVMQLRGASVSFISERALLEEDCTRADLVVAFFPASGADWRACDASLIDRRSIWKRGAHAVWIEPGGGVRIKTVVEARGRRPWTGD